MLETECEVNIAINFTLNSLTVFLTDLLLTNGCVNEKWKMF